MAIVGHDAEKVESRARAEIGPLRRGGGGGGEEFQSQHPGTEARSSYLPPLPPLRFSDHALGTWNEAVAAALRANDRDAPRHPGAGPPDGAEAARLDELRGDLSRSEVLRRAIRAA